MQNPVDYAAEGTYEGPDAVKGALKRFGRDFGDKLQRAGFDVVKVPLELLADEERVARYGLVEFTRRHQRGNDVYVCTRRSSYSVTDR
jgi:hypothetical protein